LATIFGIGTRAAGDRRSRPSSTASASAARSTVRKMMIDRRAYLPPAARSSSHRDTSSRSNRLRRIDPSPSAMWPAAHSYWSRDLALTSVRDAAHRVTTEPTVVRAEPRRPSAMASFAAAVALRRVRPELPRPVFARLGVDPVEAHHPLAPLLAHRRLSRRLPPHRPTPNRSVGVTAYRAVPVPDG
jgi:hypothetical protein